MGLFRSIKATTLMGLAASVGGTLFITACGGTSTNPLDGYKDVRAKARPVSDLPPKVQPTPVPPPPPETVDNPTPEPEAIASLFPAPDTQGEVLNFIEGQEKAYTLDIPVLLTGATFTIAGEEMPDDSATLTHVEGTKYALKWAPKNFVPQGQKFAAATINIVLKATGFADSKSLETYKKAAKSHQLRLNVFPAQSKLPLIQNIKIASATISEGDNVAIAVMVLDPSGAPSLQVLETDDTEFLKAARFVKMQSKPESLGGGRFRFSGKLSAAQISVPTGAVTAAFSLKATNASSKESSPVSDLAIKVLSKKAGSEK